MKKIYLTTILTICILTFSIGITGCSNTNQKSDVTKSQSSTVKKTNGTSVSNSSSTSKDTALAEASNSSSNSGTKTIDYNQYIKKVWVVKGSANKAYNYSSFCISKIANGKIEGKLATNAIAEPSYYYYIPNHLGYLGNLTGTINNNTAECQFSDNDGDKGNVTLTFKANDEIKATIKYTNKSNAYKDLSLDGAFLFIPNNLKDMNNFTPFKDQCFTVNLNSWGNVNFVSGKVTGGKHIPTLFYLTNKNGDILYNFDSPFPYSVTPKAVSFKDINKDGLKDIIIIVSANEDSSSSIAKVFFQKADGSFNNDGKLDQEINSSGNNKNIKTVSDYLSKKF